MTLSNVIPCTIIPLKHLFLRVQLSTVLRIQVLLLLLLFSLQYSYNNNNKKINNNMDIQHGYSTYTRPSKR